MLRPLLHIDLVDELSGSLITAVVKCLSEVHAAQLIILVSILKMGAVFGLAQRHEHRLLLFAEVELDFLAVDGRQQAVLLGAVLIVRVDLAKFRLFLHDGSGCLDAHSHGGVPPLKNGLVAVVHAQSLLEQQIGNEVGLVRFLLALSAGGGVIVVQMSLHFALGVCEFVLRRVFHGWNQLHDTFNRVLRNHSTPENVFERLPVYAFVVLQDRLAQLDFVLGIFIVFEYFMLPFPLLQLLLELVLLLADEVILKMVEIVVLIHAAFGSIDFRT